MKSFSISVFLLFCFCSARSQYMFVFLNKKADAEKLSEERSKEIMAGHFANMERLAKEKKLLAAGPFEGGGGIFILNTTNIDTAKFWVSPDTGIKANRWNVEMLPYSPQIGNVCPVSAPYTMVNYGFVRFTINGKKAQKKHEAYIRKLATMPDVEVITSGTFVNGEGGILITKSDINKEHIDNDPAVEKNAASYEIKKLYIAKGSFCEK